MIDNELKPETALRMAALFELFFLPCNAKKRVRTAWRWPDWNSQLN